MTEELYPEISRDLVGYRRIIRYDCRAGIIPCAHHKCGKAWATAFKPPGWKDDFHRSLAETARLWVNGDVGVTKEKTFGWVSPPFYACEEHRPPGYQDLDRAGPWAPICEYCGALSPKWVESATAYHWEATSLPVNPTAWDWLRFTTEDDFGPDPNRPHAFCESCAQEYNDWWDEQWREYRAAQL